MWASWRVGAVALCLLSAPGVSYAQSGTSLGRSSQIETTIGPGQTDTYWLALKTGESAELVILQQGVDVVVDVYGPNGGLVDSVDSPNGRQGPEPVTILGATPGRYRIEVKTLAADEPAGKYRLTVSALRNAAATRQWQL